VSGLESLARQNWDSFALVDLYEKYARDEESSQAQALREMQVWEMALLLEQTIK
jgi:hypothetical protein